METGPHDTARFFRQGGPRVFADQAVPYRIEPSDLFRQLRIRTSKSQKYYFPKDIPIDTHDSTQGHTALRSAAYGDGTPEMVGFLVVQESDVPGSWVVQSK